MVTTHTNTSDPRIERRLIWQAQFLCAMGQGMGAILLVLAVLSADHGPAAIGLCLAATLLPAGLGVTRAGARTEARSRRRQLVGAQLTLAVIAAALALVPEPGIAVLAFCAAGSGLARLSFDTACMSVLHHLVPKRRLGGATRDLTGHFHAGHLCGLGLAAMLLPAGQQPLFAICAGLFAAGAAVSARHHLDIDLRPDERPALDAAIAESRGVLWGHARLRPLTLAAVTAAAAAGGAGALIVPYLQVDLGLGHQASPVLMSGLVSLGLALVVLPRVIGRMPATTTAAIALCAHPVALTVLALSDDPRQAAAGYACLLGASAVLGALVNHRRAGHVHGDLVVPIGLAGGALSARAAAAGALGVGLVSIPLGDAGAWMALAAACLAGAAAAGAVRFRPAPQPA